MCDDATTSSRCAPASDEIVEDVLDRAGREPATDGFRHGRERRTRTATDGRGVAQWVQAVTDPGAVVLVVCRGDDDLVGFEGRTGWHFPQAPDGDWAGHHPADSDAAIRHLEALREPGRRLPRAAQLVLLVAAPLRGARRPPG